MMRSRAVLLAVFLLVIACAPAQPAVRSSAAAVTAWPTLAATPTPSPTATPSPVPTPKPIADVIAQIDLAKMEAHLNALTAVGSRDPRHPGHAKAVAYIKQQIAAIPGLVITSQLASYQGIPLENILVTVPPEGPAREGFLGGGGMIYEHYDSTANRTPGWRPALDTAPGADDNATGTAALLEYARILATDRASLRMPIVLAFFDGEEYFFKGSLAYLQSLPPPNPYRWVINIDMVGFNPLADRLDLVYYTSKSVSLRDRVKEANQRYAIGISPLVEQLATTDAFILDAAPFGLVGGIPSVALVQRYGEIDSTFPGNFTFPPLPDTPDKITNKRLWLKAAKLTLATALDLARGGAQL